MQYQATPLHVASYGGHCDVAQLLLEKGAELNARADVSIIIPCTYIHVHVHVVCTCAYIYIHVCDYLHKQGSHAVIKSIIQLCIYCTCVISRGAPPWESLICLLPSLKINGVRVLAPLILNMLYHGTCTYVHAYNYIHELAELETTNWPFSVHWIESGQPLYKNKVFPPSIMWHWLLGGKAPAPLAFPLSMPVVIMMYSVSIFGLRIHTMDIQHVYIICTHVHVVTVPLHNAEGTCIYLYKYVYMYVRTCTCMYIVE